MSVLPFDDRDGVIWFDGKLVPWRDAKLHVLTHGLHYASCVFEGERAYGGRVFKLTEHSQRLHRSAELLGFKIPYSVAEIDDAAAPADRREQADRRLCPAGGLAGQRDDGRLGAEEHASISPSRPGSGRPISRPSCAPAASA